MLGTCLRGVIDEIKTWIIDFETSSSRQSCTSATSTHYGSLTNERGRDGTPYLGKPKGLDVRNNKDVAADDDSQEAEDDEGVESPRRIVVVCKFVGDLTKEAGRFSSAKSFDEPHTKQSCHAVNSSSLSLSRGCRAIFMARQAPAPVPSNQQKREGSESIRTTCRLCSAPCVP